MLKIYFPLFCTRSFATQRTVAFRGATIHVRRQSVIIELRRRRRRLRRRRRHVNR